MATGLASIARPAASYADAVARVGAVCARDTAEINPVCRTRFLTHGRRVERAVVLFHGLTNCPQQYRTLAPQLFESGYNVLVPRVPRHGLADRLTDQLASLTAEELAASADEAVDIASGLGEQVAVFGLSMGGVLAGWVAQHRSEVERAVIAAPGFGLQAVPLWLTPLAWRLARRLPNRFMWFDPVRKDEPIPPLHAYPRYATRALAELLRLSAAIQARARRAAPAARSIVVVTNASDTMISNVTTARVAELWRRNGAGQLHTYEFGANLGLLHDLIDPDQIQQRTDLVYPVLLEFIMA